MKRYLTKLVWIVVIGTFATPIGWALELLISNWRW